ncbi:MAG TPA: hypothetical protein VFU15_03785 [Bacteroidia bacterium]|nr:hypothetical protein [Bacteroidia bacterium]
MAEHKEIRVAVLCRGYVFDSWEAECIREVQSLPFVKIVLLVQENYPEKKISLSKKIIDYPYRRLKWRVYKRFFLRVPAMKPASIQKELDGIPVVKCTPELKGKFSEHFPGEVIAKIKEQRCDVVLRFGFNILRGEILSATRYGVWSFHHADEQVIRGGPGGFWEIYKGIPATGAILQRLTEKLDAGIILRKGNFRTIFHSYRDNLDQLLRGTTSWMKQALIDAANGVSPAENGTPVKTNAPVFTYPRNLQMRIFRRRLLAGKIRFHFRALFRAETWTIGYVEQEASSLLEENPFGNVHWFPEAGKGKYLADPFGRINEKKELVIYAEEYDYAKKKGIICRSEGKTFSPFLEKKEHLSYPFLVNDNGTDFLVPECFESGKIFCVNAQNATEERILLGNFPAVDATPVKWNGRWWIFCTKEGEFSNTELYVFHSENFAGPWQPHANNPVKTDILSARPAGTPFVVNGRLYRPSQVCAPQYGVAVKINEVTKLSPIEFSEIAVREHAPPAGWKFSKGLHTVSVAGDRTILIDAKRYAFNFDNFRRVLKTKLKRLFRK